MSASGGRGQPKGKEKTRRQAEWSIDRTPTKRQKGAGKGKGVGYGSPPDKKEPLFEYVPGTVKTPNGLERMAGGNPAGAPCNRFFGPEKHCPFATCSFSHVKKTK